MADSRVKKEGVDWTHYHHPENWFLLSNPSIEHLEAILCFATFCLNF
jgi:hypothetical protein